MRITRRLAVLAIAGSLAAVTVPASISAEVSTSSTSTVASPVAANQTLLPTVGPQGLDVVEDSWDTLDSVSTELAEVTTREEIAAQGYIGGATRVWSASDPASIPNGEVAYLEISIHAIGDAEGAEASLPYIAEAFQLRGLQPLEVDGSFGDQSQFFTVTDPASNLTIDQVLVQQGAAIYQVQVRVVNGDPLPALLTWLETLGLAQA
jgi:hypothetical protein